MKKLIALALTSFVLCGFAAADIHTPPGSEYTASRKLGRALSNIVYGFMEIPEQVVRKNERFGGEGGYAFGAVDGTGRALRRLGYGFYELFTFTCPTYRGTFRPPYESCGVDNRIEMNVQGGLSEFPPQLGAETYYRYSRAQRF